MANQRRLRGSVYSIFEAWTWSQVLVPPELFVAFLGQCETPNLQQGDVAFLRLERFDSFRGRQGFGFHHKWFIGPA